MIYYCRHHKKIITRGKAINYCLKSNCWALKIFRVKNELQAFFRRSETGLGKKIFISREQWGRIRRGTILIDFSGNERVVLKKEPGDYMLLLRKKSGIGTTAYCYTDLYFKYKIKKY